MPRTAPVRSVRTATRGAALCVTATLCAAAGLTLGSPTAAADASACPLPVTHEIGSVQGSGTTTPLAGTQVTVSGVVVGDVPGLAGFYLQDPDGDGDATTSDGIFVFSPAAVALGDTVQVSGSPSEFGEQTQISSREGVTVCSPAPQDPLAALPEAASLDLPADDAARARLEGMRVRPADVLTVSEVFKLVQFGELVLSEGGVLVQPTEAARPGPAARAVAAGNAVRRIVLDDASSRRTSASSRPYLSPTTPVRVGDPVAWTSPVVLGFGFGAWRLQPADGTPEGTFAPQNTRPAAPAAVGGDVRVGAFNVLNYFLTYSGPNARGARSAEQHERQAAKIVRALEAMDAHVVALMEIEDTATTGYGDGSPDQAVAGLARRLNSAAGYDKWAYPPFPAELLAVERDAIRNAVIYQRDVVQAVGPSVGLVDEANFDNAREPIAQTFAKDGDRFTVVANHLKSKRSGTDAVGDNADSGDGQGSYNGDRVRQAQWLRGFLDELVTSTGDGDVVAMGDFNAYSQEDPIQVLAGAGLTDLGAALDEGHYSYVFDALSGSLDHALATAPLTAKVTGATHWNVNSVESVAYQYTGDRRSTRRTRTARATTTRWSSASTSPRGATAWSRRSSVRPATTCSAGPTRSTSSWVSGATTWSTASWARTSCAAAPVPTRCAARTATTRCWAASAWTASRAATATTFSSAGPAPTA